METKKKEIFKYIVLPVKTLNINLYTKSIFVLVTSAKEFMFLLCLFIRLFVCVMTSNVMNRS